MRIALAVVVAVGAGLAAGLVIGKWYVAQESRPTAEEAARGTPKPAPQPIVRYDEEPAHEEAPPVPPPATVQVPAQLPSPQPAGMPAWRRLAVASVAEPGRPMIAIIIDDMGVDRSRTERILTLPGPLTTSFLPYAHDLRKQTAEARSRGHELMVHVPMEPLGRHNDPGPDVLDVGRSAEDLHARLVHGLDRFPGYVGINNHMGSRFTGDENGMKVVMEELRARGLLFVDSVTTDHSVGGKVASSYEVPYAERDVFLDNDSDVNLIRQQLDKLEAVARKRGYAVAIGHPRDATIEALAEWLPTVRRRGLALVPVSAIVRHRFPEG